MRLYGTTLPSMPVDTAQYIPNELRDAYDAANLRESALVDRINELQRERDALVTLISHVRESIDPPMDASDPGYDVYARLSAEPADPDLLPSTTPA